MLCADENKMTTPTMTRKICTGLDRSRLTNLDLIKNAANIILQATYRRQRTAVNHSFKQSNCSLYMLHSVNSSHSHYNNLCWYIITLHTCLDVTLTVQIQLPSALRIIIHVGSDRRPETKQGIERKIVRFRSGRVRDRDRRSGPDRRSEAINFGAC